MLGGMGKPDRRAGRRHPPRPHRGADRRLHLLGLQGRRRLRRHPRRPLRDAAGHLRPQVDGPGVTMTTKRVTLLILAIIVIASPLFFPSNYYYRVGSLIFVNGLAVTGMVILTGYAGQISLGHAGFAGIGAYACALAPVHLGLHPGLAAILGAAISAAARLAGRPPGPPPQGLLPRRRHPRPRHPRLHGARQRGLADRAAPTASRSPTSASTTCSKPSASTSPTRSSGTSSPASCW